jgi:hypothetical protein
MAVVLRSAAGEFGHAPLKRDPRSSANSQGMGCRDRAGILHFVGSTGTMNGNIDRVSQLTARS